MNYSYKTLLTCHTALRACSGTRTMRRRTTGSGCVERVGSKNDIDDDNDRDNDNDNGMKKFRGAPFTVGCRWEMIMIMIKIKMMIIIMVKIMIMIMV